MSTLKKPGITMALNTRIMTQAASGQNNGLSRNRLRNDVCFIIHLPWYESGSARPRCQNIRRRFYGHAPPQHNGPFEVLFSMPFLSQPILPKRLVFCGANKPIVTLCCETLRQLGMKGVLTADSFVPNCVKLTPQIYALSNAILQWPECLSRKTHLYQHYYIHCLL